MKQVIQYLFKDTLKQHNAGEKIDKKLIKVLLISTLCLLMVGYFKNFKFLLYLFRSFGLVNIKDSLVTLSKSFNDYRLFSLGYWSIAIFIFYFAVPALIIKFHFKEPLTNYGISIKKAFSGYKIYLVFFLIMFPLVIGVSFTDAFQQRYPFYKPVAGDLYPKFVIWQVLYLLQFFAVEFFYRGFMIHGTKHKLGFYSIFVMVIPYMMIHINKPILECLGAIVAGVFLGALSLKSKTIWLGVFIHYSVAITMDIAALIQQGYFR